MNEIEKMKKSAIDAVLFLLFSLILITAILIAKNWDKEQVRKCADNEVITNCDQLENQ